MTVMEFQDAIEKAGLEGNSVIDSLVDLSHPGLKSSKIEELAKNSDIHKRR